MFLNSAPVLYVSDLTKSLDYYCNVLEFERPKLWGHPASFAMPKKENIIIMLKFTKDKLKIQPKNDIWDVYFWIKDAWDLFKVYQKNGAIVVREPTLIEQYNNLEFALKDPDGYTLAFGQELS